MIVGNGWYSKLLRPDWFVSFPEQDLREQYGNDIVLKVFLDNIFDYEKIDLFDINHPP